MARLESEPLSFANFSLAAANGGEGRISAPNLKSPLELSSIELDYLKSLMGGTTIEDLVQKKIAGGRLPNFTSLFDLLKRLTEKRLLLNQSAREQLLNENLSHPDQTLDSGGAGMSFNEFCKIPFIRDLSPELQHAFYADCLQYETGARTRVCTEGQKSRDLFALLEGDAGVYRGGQYIARLAAPALFGEAGFLLGRPRSADVITLTPSRILRIRFKPEYDSIIKKEQATALQERFWVQHALYGSPLFRELPADSLDELTFSGNLKKIAANETLFAQDSIGTQFYVIVQGQLQVLQNGRRINTLEQGDCLGEIALLLNQGRRTASVQSTRQSLVLEISAERFYRLLAGNLNLAALLEKVAHERLHGNID